MLRPRIIPSLLIKDKGLVEVGAVGFGCVLVKKHVMVSIGYPQFKYYPALDHSQTFSEDLDFARRCYDKNIKLWCDTTIKCDHHGSHVFRV